MNNKYSTRKNRVRYHFVTPSEVEDKNPDDDKITYFYQICLFPDLYDNMYNLRIFLINGKQEFLDIKKYKLTKHQFKDFRKKTLPHKYKGYNTYTLDNIGYPTLADFLVSQSDILETNYNYSGFAPFHKY